MQNRNSNEARSSSLPAIKRSWKYNQSVQLIHEKYRAREAVKNFTVLCRDKENVGDRFEQSVNVMRKLKKSFVGDKEKEKDKASRKNTRKYIINKTYVENCYYNDRGSARLDINLGLRKINTRQKPPHRYKTTMAIFKHCLLLYGGLGCQKNLTWARLNFSTLSWQISHSTPTIKPINSYIPFTPIYGHTMCKHKDTAIIYGGCCNDQINETTLINARTMEIVQGARCPLRRKQHAALVLGDLMFVHGGIEAREVRGEVFVYAVGLDRWNLLINANMPVLAGHRLAKGKTNRQFYMFGGLNSRYKSQNKLYRIKYSSPETLQLKLEQIDQQNPPNPRHSFTLQSLSNNLLLLYGGQQDNETDYPEQGLERGVFNDVHVYNMDRKGWTRVDLGMGLGGLGYCFGMASTCSGGTVFVYGGSGHRLYADAGINIIWNADERGDPWESVQQSEWEITSSKRVSNQLINL